MAASTFPEQVVDADRWVQAHPDLKDDALAQAVDQQPWDPSVKALVAFPSILGNMDKTFRGPRPSATHTTTRNRT